jgi:hypothetical protein
MPELLKPALVVIGLRLHEPLPASFSPTFSGYRDRR